jgi:hypothetical protein
VGGDGSGIQRVGGSLPTSNAPRLIVTAALAFPFVLMPRSGSMSVTSDYDLWIERREEKQNPRSIFRRRFKRTPGAFANRTIRDRNNNVLYRRERFSSRARKIHKSLQLIEGHPAD